MSSNDTRKHKGHQYWMDPYWMICNAQSLQAAANYLSENLDPKENGPLFTGKTIAGPILMALATEIALKALQCQERKKAPDPTHDLLKLFKELGEDTQGELEEALPSQLDPVSIRLGTQDFCPVGAGM